MAFHWKVFVLLLNLFAASLVEADDVTPQTFVYNGTALAQVRGRVQKQDPSLMPAVEKLRRSADGLLDKGEK